MRGIARIGNLTSYRPGQSEIQHLCVPVWAQEDVFRFNIGMDNAVSMSHGKCFGDLLPYMKNLLQGLRSCAERPQRSSFNQLHNDYRSLSVPDHFVNGHNVRDG